MTDYQCAFCGELSPTLRMLGGHFGERHMEAAEEFGEPAIPLFRCVCGWQIAGLKTSLIELPATVRDTMAGQMLEAIGRHADQMGVACAVMAGLRKPAQVIQFKKYQFKAGRRKGKGKK